MKAGNYDAPKEFDILRGLVGVSKPEDLMEPLSGEDLMGMTAVVVSRLGFEDTEITVTERRNSLDTVFDGLPDEELLYEAFMGAIWNDITPYHKLAEAPGFGLNGAFGPSPMSHQPRPRNLIASRHLQRCVPFPKSLQARALTRK